MKQKKFAKRNVYALCYYLLVTLSQNIRPILLELAYRGRAMLRVCQ